MVASLKKSTVFGKGEEAVDLTAPASEFNFGEFFQGHTRASGWFSDRFGKPRRHFCGEFFGYYDDSEFVLDEKLFYTDGIIEERLWRVTIDTAGNFRARSDSLLGDATGKVSSNTLAMRYSMKVMIEEGTHWDLDMRDTMILQPDGSLHNINHVYKWGIRIGTVSAQYIREPGDKVKLHTRNRTTQSGRTREEGRKREKVTHIDR